MLERRPIWGILIGLTICISIWRISIQEPSMLAAEYVYSNGGGGIIIDGDGEDLSNVPPNSAHFEKQIHGGKRLLARKSNSEQELNESIGTETEIAHSNVRRKFEFDKNSQSKNYETKDDEVNATNRNSTIVNKTSYSLINSGKYSRKVNKTLIEFQRGAVIAAPSPLAIVISQQKHHDTRSSDSLSVTTTTTLTTPTSPLELAVTLAGATTKRTVTVDNFGKQLPPLPPDDFQQLIDLHKFDYIMRQPDCDTHIYALILVHSAPGNYKKRQLIRMTWASCTSALSQDNAALRVIFLLGAVTNQTLQQQLQQENLLYADMVQGNFMDDYKNMTYKHVMAFKWFAYSCTNAQLLVKVDDDVFVNTPQLLTYIKDARRLTNDMTTTLYRNVNSIINHPSGKLQLSERLRNHPQNLLFCQQVFDARVKRSYRSKWRVSVREYAGHFYPPYCPGYAIIYSPDIVQRLYRAAQNTKYFWIDDVHVTGTLVQQLNITTTSSLPYVLSKEQCENVLAGNIAPADLEFVFAWPDITEQDIGQLWQLLKENKSSPVLYLTEEERYLNEGFR